LKSTALHWIYLFNTRGRPVAMHFWMIDHNANQIFTNYPTMPWSGCNSPWFLSYCS